MSADAEALIRKGALAYEAFQDRRVLPLIRSHTPPAVADPMIYCLSAPGKRLRPLLLMLCAGVTPDAADAPAADPVYLERVLFAAAAVEAIHTYSLIHDDLPCMDDDDLRRGRPSCHVAFGEWAAVLAGDGLNTFAFRLLAEPGDTHNTAPLVRILADAAGGSGMVGGQALDLQAERGQGSGGRLTGGSSERREHAVSAELLDEIHAKKTAALIAAACEMGALCSGLEPPVPHARHGAFGRSLGLLFQISDDVLDEQGSTEELGKTAGQDRAHGKLTYPALYGVERSRERCAELLTGLRAEVHSLPVGPRAPADTRPLLEAVCRFTAARSR